MLKAHNNKYPNDSNEEINLLELFYVLLEGKWIIVFITSFASIFAVFFSLSLPNVYESKALLAPVNSSAVSGVLGSYSGLADFAGITIPSTSDEDNSAKAMQKINSLSFFKNNIMPKIHLPDLMAFKAWDLETNTVIYNEKSYDTKTNTWIRGYSYPKQQIPSAQESFEVFKSKLSLNLDKSSGFSTLSIKHQSPFIAKEWTELVVNEINTFYRQKDKLESERAVTYLNQQVSTTGLSEIKEVLAQLLQEEVKKLTLIEANQFYVFEYIDPPVVMERKSAPHRALICILIAFLGGILGIVSVIVRHYVFSKKIT